MVHGKRLEIQALLSITSFTNVSATTGTYTAKNYAFGINECGQWMDSVLVRFMLKTQPQNHYHTGRQGLHTWLLENHPEAFDQWLPVTILWYQR